MFLYSFDCLHNTGQYRKRCRSVSTYFATFSYYTFDVEDGIDSMKGYAVLGGVDFDTYNLFLLWIFPRASSMIIQLCVFFGLVITIQLGLWLTYWFGKRWDEFIGPNLHCPVVFVSAYALVLYFIQQNVDIGCAEMLYTDNTCRNNLIL